MLGLKDKAVHRENTLLGSPMNTALRITGSALRDVWSDLWTVLVCDFLWLLSVVLVIPGPPATLALFAFANRLVKDEAVDLKDFWMALRRYWRPAWRWGWVNLFVLFFLIGDIYLTGRGNPTPMSRFVQSFYLTAVLAWLLVQLYMLPFLLEEENSSVRQALRNGAVMLGRNPVYSVCLGVCLLLVFLLGFPVFLLSVGFGPMFLACAGNRAVLLEIEKLYRREHGD